MRHRQNPDTTVLGLMALSGAALLARQFGEARQLGGLQKYYDRVAGWLGGLGKDAGGTAVIRKRSGDTGDGVKVIVEVPGPPAEDGTPTVVERTYTAVSIPAGEPPEVLSKVRIHGENRTDGTQFMVSFRRTGPARDYTVRLHWKHSDPDAWLRATFQTGGKYFGENTFPLDRDPSACWYIVSPPVAVIDIADFTAVFDIDVNVQIEIEGRTLHDQWHRQVMTIGGVNRTFEPPPLFNCGADCAIDYGDGSALYCNPSTGEWVHYVIDTGQEIARGTGVCKCWGED